MPNHRRKLDLQNPRHRFAHELRELMDAALIASDDPQDIGPLKIQRETNVAASTIYAALSGQRFPSPLTLRVMVLRWDSRGPSALESWRKRLAQAKQDFREYNTRTPERGGGEAGGIAAPPPQPKGGPRPTPEARQTTEAFSARLRYLRAQAGDPTFRSMAHISDYSPSALAAVVNRPELPSFPALDAFLKGIGLDEESRHDVVRDWLDASLQTAELQQRQGNQRDAERLYRRAAEQGHTKAMNKLGLLLAEQGHLGEAETWYRKAAEQGRTKAMFNLGPLLAEQGHLGEAETWYRKAVEQGHTDAMNNLGHLLAEQGRLGEAEEWFRRAVEQGRTNAMNNLGLLLRKADRVEEAETWYRKAAEQGNIKAMYNLGLLLREVGRLGEAETWFRKAVEQGDTDAMNKLGLLLTETDRLGEAEEWFRKAADAGDTGAMFNLGVLLEEAGRAEEAEEWRRRAREAEGEE